MNRADGVVHVAQSYAACRRACIAPSTSLLGQKAPRVPPSLACGAPAEGEVALGAAAPFLPHTPDGNVTSSAPTQQPQSPPPRPRRKREILGPTGLVVMVLVILAATAVSIVVELASNHGRTYTASVDVLDQMPGDPNEYQVVFHITNQGTKAGRPDVCDATLFDMRGERVGTASVRLRDAVIEPGRTLDELAVATAASTPVNGTVHCRALEPE